MIIDNVPASSSRVTVEPWVPEVEVDTESMLPATVYVLPTRTIKVDETPTVVFDDSVRYVPKYARAAGAPTQFAPVPGERRFLSEYSFDPGDWELALTFVGFFNDWLVMAVNAWLTSRSQMTGLSPSEVMEHEMEIEIAEWNPKKGKFSGLRLKGKGTDVVNVIRELRAFED